MAKKKSQRLETLMRIVVGIVSGIILWIWNYLVWVFFVVNFVWSLISGKRIKELAELSEIWMTQAYHFYRYMTFNTNERPFPFTKLKKSMGKFQK